MKLIFRKLKNNMVAKAGEIVTLAPHSFAKDDEDDTVLIFHSIPNASIAAISYFSYKGIMSHSTPVSLEECGELISKIAAFSHFLNAELEVHLTIKE